MSNLQRLLRVATARNKRDEYRNISIRILKSLHDSLKARCTEDRISVPALIEAVVRGFVNKHPSVLAMVDQWVRDEGLELQSATGPVLTKKDLSEVYAAIGENTLTEE